MLLPRFLTALFGIPLILLLIWIGYLPFFFLVYGIIFLGLYEFYYLWVNKGYRPDKIFGYIFGSFLLFSLYLQGRDSPLLSEGAGLVFTLGILFYLALNVLRKMFTKQETKKSYFDLVLTFWGVVYVVWLLGHLVLLRELRPFGREYTYLLFLSAWFSDTAAYAVGIKFGRYPLAKKISPKKTWEGTIAGLVTGILVALIFKILFLKHFGYVQALVIGAILSAGGLFGDLSESFLKRQLEVKDTSDLLPGHGGILDRFDTIIFTAPILYYYLRLFI